jgi:hypothetical protein
VPPHLQAGRYPLLTRPRPTPHVGSAAAEKRNNVSSLPDLDAIEETKEAARRRHIAPRSAAGFLRCQADCRGYLTDSISAFATDTKFAFNTGVGA